MSAWQPIETAPKDGVVILWLTGRGGNATLAYWNDDRYASKPKPRWISTETRYGRRDLIDNPPSHWQPLPAPPVQP